jgi:peptidoglycan hydrolase CwlO-like protein
MEVFEMRDLTPKILKFLMILVLACFFFTILYRQTDISLDSYASASACPESMPNEERLECLKQEMSKIETQKQSVEGSINAENFEQLTLYEQVNYLSSMVEETELKISEIEIDIETKNLEVLLLGETILELQNNIDTLLQEINRLELTMNDRTVTSYKISLMSPVEIMLESHDLETMMRRIKYLLEMKKKDREILVEMKGSRSELEEEEETLAQMRSEVQEKRNEIENQRSELAEERANLESQKEQQQFLLAESQQREQEYLQQLEQLRALEAQANQQIAQLIMQMYEQGQLGDGTKVDRGDYIGQQGHSGYSYGSHLHFSVNDGTNYTGWGYFWGNVNPYSYINSSIPLPESLVTQGYHQGLSIDLISTTAGNQLDDIYGKCWQNPTTNQCYYANRGSITCDPDFEGWLSLEGEGAPIRSVSTGKVYYGTENYCGGKFAMVVEDGTGYVSIYLHLKPQ